MFGKGPFSETYSLILLNQISWELFEWWTLTKLKHACKIYLIFLFRYNIMNVLKVQVRFSSLIHCFDLHKPWVFNKYARPAQPARPVKVRHRVNGKIYSICPRTSLKSVVLTLNASCVCQLQMEYLTCHFPFLHLLQLIKLCSLFLWFIRGSWKSYWARRNCKFTCPWARRKLWHFNTPAISIRHHTCFLLTTWYSGHQAGTTSLMLMTPKCITKWSQDMWTKVLGYRHMHSFMFMYLPQWHIYLFGNGQNSFRNFYFDKNKHVSVF